MILNDCFLLVGLIGFCGFISYTAGQVAGAIHSILQD